MASKSKLLRSGTILAVAVLLTSCGSSTIDVSHPVESDESSEVATTTVTQSFEPLQLEGEAITEHFTIPSGLTADDFAEHMTGLLNDRMFLNGGTQFIQDAFESPLSINDYAENKAKEVTPYLVKGLFTEESQSDPLVQNFIRNDELVNIASLEMSVITSPDAGDPDNEEIYYRSYSVVDNSVSEVASTESRTITFDLLHSDNSDKNMANEIWERNGGKSHNGETFTLSFTLVSDGSTEKISAVK